RTSMNDARATTIAISQGLALPAATSAGPLTATAGALMTASAGGSDKGSQPLVERPLWIDAHARHNGHAGSKRDIGRRIVDDDLHRHPLDDFDVVAGRVLRR